MREGNAERGFTLVELMAVVAIVAVLAAVVIPSFMSETTKSKRMTEVSAMFAEIGAKQDQFKAERGKYMGLSTGTDYEGTTTCPSTLPSADYNFATACMAAAAAWTELRVSPASSSLRCQYSITAGKQGTTLTPPTGFLNSQGAADAEPVLASAWYYVHAKCDEKAGGNASEYYQSSVDRKIQKLNEGQ